MLKSFKFVVLKFVVHICNKAKTNESQRVKEYGIIAFPCPSAVYPGDRDVQV